MKLSHFFLEAQRQEQHNEGDALQRTILLLIALMILASLGLMMLSFLDSQGIDLIARVRS